MAGPAALGGAVTWARPCELEPGSESQTAGRWQFLKSELLVPGPGRRGSAAFRRPREVTVKTRRCDGVPGSLAVAARGPESSESGPSPMTLSDVSGPHGLIAMIPGILVLIY